MAAAGAEVQPAGTSHFICGFSTLGGGGMASTEGEDAFVGIVASNGGGVDSSGALETR